MEKASPRGTGAHRMDKIDLTRLLDTRSYKPASSRDNEYHYPSVKCDGTRKYSL